VRTAVELCEGAPPAPSNDSCADPITVTDGTTEFSNFGATTDGPPSVSDCPAPGEGAFPAQDVESDIWFCYTATCDGIAIISLCGSSYDTTMAAYSGCGCPVNGASACSDDDCGFALDSRVTIPVRTGAELMIRIGGYLDEQGTGELTIICGPDASNSQVCGAGNGDCAAANDSPGCDDTVCCIDVCAVDAYCCDVEWDETCRSEATGICGGSFESCGGDTGDCSTANGSAGCTDAACCNSVCDVDAFCCVVDWDDMCAAAGASCP